MVSFKQEQNKFEREFNEKLAKLVFATHGEIVRNTPVDTGRLRSSIVVEEPNDDNLEWIIGTNVPYAEQVELGMQPTVIRPKNGKALKFQVGGETVFAKKVNHPGFEGRAMFQKGVSFAEANIKKFLR